MTRLVKTSAASLKVLKARATAASRAATFVALCHAHGLPAPVMEYKFWTGRRFAFDFAWPAQMIALESEGGAFSGGGHTRGLHFKGDCLKYSEAAIRGWCVIRVLSSDLCTDDTINLVRRALLAWSKKP